MACLDCSRPSISKRCPVCARKFYRLTNPEKYYEMRRRTAKNRRARIKTNSLIIQTPEHQLHQWLRQLHRWMRKRKIDHTITVEDLFDLYKQQKGRCAITKIPMTWAHRDIRAISLDRKNSNGGYHKDNIQLVCQWINFGKRHEDNQQISEFIEDIRRDILRKLVNGVKNGRIVLT